MLTGTEVRKVLLSDRQIVVKGFGRSQAAMQAFNVAGRVPKQQPCAHVCTHVCTYSCNIDMAICAPTNSPHDNEDCSHSIGICLLGGLVKTACL